MEKKITVLNQIGNYTLVYRHTVYEPFVVAWKFDPVKQDWCQGHYFESCQDARLYMENIAR